MWISSPSSSWPTVRHHAGLLPAIPNAQGRILSGVAALLRCRATPSRRVASSLQQSSGERLLLSAILKRFFLSLPAGILTKLLVHTKVTRYMEFKVIDGSFVYIGPTGGFFGSSSGSIHKVRCHTCNT